jgi:hypothetical protein
MNATLSTRQLRLVGLLVLVVVAAGGYFVTKHKSSTPTTASSTPASTTPAQTTPSQSKGHTRSVTPPAKFDTHGLPLAIAQALRKHSVVVVALAAPGAAVDQMAAAEAHAGAMEMGAGFVKLDVYHQRPGIDILRKIGVVNTPALLVVKKPDLIYSEFRGFVDRDVVEQAVADAR